MSEVVRMKERLFLKTSGSHLYKVIGTLCSREPRAFISMLQANPSLPWGDIALSSTNEATPEVIRESLQLIRVPDTQENIRVRIFQWLCRIKIIHESAITPEQYLK